MKTHVLTTIGTTIIALLLNASAANLPGPNKETTTALPQLARSAVSENSELAVASIQSLREAGPAGLDALFNAHGEILAAHTSAMAAVFIPSQDGQWQRIRTALDAVGMQRDCYASHLFWFTDLEQAREEAQQSGKPILSLRLLGNLNEEYSCANSRFFRTTLYANAEVSRFLRENYVLHWESVRPVPRITVDFGDGRRLEHTITGNSIHYILDSQGRVIDALPGLYGATAFIEGLERARRVALVSAALKERDFTSQLRNYHARRALEVDLEFQKDLTAISRTPAALSVTTPSLASTAPGAKKATTLTRSKMGLEAPLLKQAVPESGAELSPRGSALSDTTWQAIAALHAEGFRLDHRSTRLIRDKTVSAAEAARRAISKRIVEDPMIRTLQNLERSIAEDTVRNEYLLHSQIHEWFRDGTAPPDLDELNAKVYAELFLTPDTDPWLGLAPPDVFAALEDNGLVLSTANPKTR